MTGLGPWRPPPSAAERRAYGRRLRDIVPRTALAALTLHGRDVAGVLDRQNDGRLPDLLPLRHERMAADPFSFLRGAAAVMAADLARDAGTGIRVASCGDAHVANFGFYASPQRSLVFDVNDFDEAAWAPWEWDLKRLVTSIVVAGQTASRSEPVVADAARSAVVTYARLLRTGATTSAVERYFAHFDPAGTLAAADPGTRTVVERAMHEAQRRTGARAARKLTETDPDGRMRLIERPPTTVHVSDEVAAQVAQATADYTASTTADVRLVLSQYSVADLARRVVGVGSVGTRCFLVLLQDGDGHALLMQPKEAVESVLVRFGGAVQPAEVTTYVRDHGHGARVVGLQRILQAVSDPFLGHLRTAEADFYVRQFHDMKGGVDAAALDDRPFRDYATACAAVLARAHAQSANAASVSGYLGGGRAAAEAILAWALAYADVNRADWAAFAAAQPAAPPG